MLTIFQPLEVIPITATSSIVELLTTFFNRVKIETLQESITQSYLHWAGALILNDIKDIDKYLETAWEIQSCKPGRDALFALDTDNAIAARRTNANLILKTLETLLTQYERRER